MMHNQGWRPNEADVDAVVAIHNAVNEKAWENLKRWEKLLHPECEPKLVKIRGLSTTYSPKAKLYKMLGYEPPFDRHDWEIDRCGASVRYVIDYYADTPSAPGKVAGLYIDLRPALDSPTAAWDRLRMSLKQ